MIELTGRIIDLSLDFVSGKPKLTIELNEKQETMSLYDEFNREEKLSFRISKFREKRSLNANAYAWKLLTEIGNILRSNKETVYLEMLKRYGQREVISVQAHIPINGFIKYFEEIGESSTNGKLFKHYFVFKGSSEFDKREMSIFIDGIVDEAKALGITTETPEQIAKMKSLWEAGE